MLTIMKEHEKWHEPQTVTDAKNAIADTVVKGVIFLLLLWLCQGLVAPFFLPSWLQEAKVTAKEKADKGEGTYEKNYATLKFEAITRSIVQCILAWGIIWFAFKSQG